MKPKPLLGLNHLTVPLDIKSLRFALKYHALRVGTVDATCVVINYCLGGTDDRAIRRTEG